MRGFGHTAFLADDLDAACAYLESEGVSFKKKPMDGNMRGRRLFAVVSALMVLMGVLILLLLYRYCLRVRPRQLLVSPCYY